MFGFINVEVIPQSENQTGLPNVNYCLGGDVSACGRNSWAEIENPWIIMLIRGMEVEKAIRDGLWVLLWPFSYALCQQILL